MTDTVSTQQLQEQSGATKRQVQFWTEQGWLRPLPRERATSGTPLQYPAAEVHVAASGRLLVDAGFRASVALDAARQIMTSGGWQHASGASDYGVELYVRLLRWSEVCT